MRQIGNFYIKKFSTHFVLIMIILVQFEMASGQEKEVGIRGDSSAIAELEAMVNTMGGMRIWGQLKSVHFVHKWFFWNKDSYIENEILDLTGPRSWVEMKNETYHRLRAYSPEHKYWNVIKMNSRIHLMNGSMPQWRELLSIYIALPELLQLVILITK